MVINQKSYFIEDIREANIILDKKWQLISILSKYLKFKIELVNKIH